MARPQVMSVLLGSVIFWLASSALADTADDYKMLFGEEDAKVAASRNTKDAADFAAKLLTVAASLNDQKDLQAFLCEKAYEFGMKSPSGYKTAVSAMKFLIDSVPDKKAQAQEKLLKAAQLRYSRTAREFRKPAAEELVDALVACAEDQVAAKRPSDAVVLYRQALSIASAEKIERAKEIMDTILKITSAQAGEKRLSDLKARVAKAPKDAAARTELILAYLGEIDTPAEAVPLLTADLDEGLRTYVPLAAGKIEDLKESVCLEMAQWYAEMAEKASPAGKGVLLGKAKACCERYLELHTARDVVRLKCTMLLEKVAKGATWSPKAEPGVAKTEQPVTAAAKPPAKDEQEPAVASAVGAKLYENRSGREDIKEFVTLARAVMAADRRLAGGQIPLDLVACYDAVKMCTHTGKGATVAGSHTEQVMVGATRETLVYGPYAGFDPGQYILAFRVAAMQAIPGRSLGWVDVATGGDAFQSANLDARLFTTPGWRYVLLPFDVDKRKDLEFRVWGRNILMAVDRIYVFKLRKTD